MKYTKPEIVATYSSTEAIQTSMAKVGTNSDGIQPTNLAYEADE